MLLARPFRCEDCIHRYFSFLWASGSNLAGLIPDSKSLVYRSSTAALHSADHRHRSPRRKVYSERPEHVSVTFAAAAAASISKPVQQPLRQKALQGNALTLRENSKPKSEFFPEILGVILEHQRS